MTTIRERPVAPIRSRIPARQAEAATVAPSESGFRRALERQGNNLGGSASSASAAPGQPTPPTTQAPASTESTASVEDTLSRTQKFNLYYLELQERIAAEQRRYTALSNVLRAQHETAKNAIGNIR